MTGVTVLLRHGYAPAPNARDLNAWDERHRQDPSIGLVRLKAVRLVDPADADSEFDDRVTFSVREFWSAHPMPRARRRRGYDLVGYSYHAHWHGVDQRWDFDPVRHPEMPYHRHPPGTDPRVPMEDAIELEDAVDAFEAWIAEQP